MVTSLPQGDEKTERVRSMFDAIAPRYELVNRLMTLGLDARWRRRAVSDLRLAPGSVVLDIAAGTGDFTRELRRQGQRAVATDLSYNMLRTARHVSERVQADASRTALSLGGLRRSDLWLRASQLHRS